MENSQQNETRQIKNLLSEINNNINQINDRITIINNIITQINNILLININNNSNNKANQMNNFTQKMLSFNLNFNDYKFQPHLISMNNFKNNVDTLNEEGFEKDVIETVMLEGKCTREKAIEALRKCNGDPVEALIEVEEEKEKVKEKNSVKKEESNKEDIDKDDHEMKINVVAKEGHCSREEAIKALENHNWDPVEALLEVGI